MGMPSLAEFDAEIKMANDLAKAIEHFRSLKMYTAYGQLGSGFVCIASSREEAWRIYKENVPGNLYMLHYDETNLSHEFEEKEISSGAYFYVTGDI